MKRFVALCIVCALFVTPPISADWPAYRADRHRSGVTGEKLTFPLTKLWTYRPSRPPAPAWPEPGKEMHRIDFDYAFQPIIAAGMVFFGSSADDAVRALDLETGQVRWRFVTGAPVRLAPHYWQGKLYVAGDDGVLYCLDGRTGAVKWKVRGAPNDRKQIGNGRMISRWPCRSGVLVCDGVVYFTAGMWPNGGVYVYALDAETGEEIWCNDTSGSLSIKQPHYPAVAFSGVTPQGYMLASDELLLVPTGRSSPGAYRRSDGHLKWYQPFFDFRSREGWSMRSTGGSWLTISGDALYMYRHVLSGPNIQHAVKESGPRPGDGLASFGVTHGWRGPAGPSTGHPMLGTPPKERQTPPAGDRAKGKARQPRRPKRRAAAPDVGRLYAVARAGTVTLYGGSDVLAAADEDGELLARLEVAGQVRGIAVADGRVVIATHTGDLICYGGGKSQADHRLIAEPKRPLNEDKRAAAQSILKSAGVAEGYALVVGAADTALAEALVAVSKLHVICALKDAGRVAAHRQRLLDSGLYGSRIVVDAMGPSKKLHYASYFADLVVAADGSGDVPATELYRVVRPCGGVLCFDGVGPARAEAILKATGAPAAEIRDGSRLVRGPLAGAGEWRYRYADAGRSHVGADSRVRLPLEILWFGGPGPGRVVPRQMAPPGAVSVAARVFVPGSREVICLDAYNGREIWARRVIAGDPHWRWPWIVADDNCVYAPTGTKPQCLRLDQATGKVVATYDVPKEIGIPEYSQADVLNWTYLPAVTDDVVVGTCIPADGKEWFASAIFGLDKSTGKTLWTMTLPKENVSRDTIACGQGLLFVYNFVSPELTAIDVRTGKQRWCVSKLGKGKSVQYGAGLVVVAGAAFDAATGEKVRDRVGNGFIFGDKIISGAGQDIRTGEPWSAADPLTGKPRPRLTWVRSYSCGGAMGCKSLLFGRSGAVGLMDTAHGGLSTIGGIRGGCKPNMIAANGLLIIPEGSSGCTCSYSFQTSLALAPGGSDNDLWFVFRGQVAKPTERIPTLRLNLGAPGDKPDSDGNGWLGYPRPGGWFRANVPVRLEPEQRHKQENSVAVRLQMHRPVRPSGQDDYGWFYSRRLADRVQGTDKPWVYGSGLEGSAKLIVRLVPRSAVIIPSCKTPPKIDARLDDDCWKGAEPLEFRGNLHLANPKTSVYARRDAHNLYFAYHRPAPLRRDKPVPFYKRRTQDVDARCWEDDSFEIAFCDDDPKRYLQIAVSAAGGRYEWLRRPGRAGDDLSGRKPRWRHAVSSENGVFVSEVAMPLAALKEAGLDASKLSINIQSRNLSKIGPRNISLTNPGPGNWHRGNQFIRVLERREQIRSYPYTVRLHFIEPEDPAPARRAFTVKVQDKDAGVDIAREAGGPAGALVRELAGVKVENELVIELSPADKDATHLPLLCGVEMLAED